MNMYWLLKRQFFFYMWNAKYPQGLCDLALYRRQHRIKQLHYLERPLACKTRKEKNRYFDYTLEIYSAVKRTETQDNIEKNAIA